MCFCNQNCAPAATKVFLQTVLCSYSQQCVFLKPSLCSCRYHYFSAANAVFLQPPQSSWSHNCVPVATIVLLQPPLCFSSLPLCSFSNHCSSIFNEFCITGFPKLYITLCCCRCHCVTLLPQVPLWRGRCSEGCRHALLWRLWVEFFATQMRE